MAAHKVLPMPDIEAVVISALQQAGVCGGRVGSKIPASPVWPLIVVRRLGGSPPEKRKLDAARIQVDVWGDTDDVDSDGKAVIRDAGDDARVAAFDLEGETDDFFDCQVTCVEDESSLQFMPDAESGRPRYIFTLVVYAQNSRPRSS